MLQEWSSLYRQLMDLQWFAHVGDHVVSEEDPSLQRVVNWSDAAKWTESEISWWCLNEASNVLSLHLNDNHNAEYQNWNTRIRSIAPVVEAIIHEKVELSIPMELRSSRIREWVKSQLTRAYMECAYSSISSVELVCGQIEWYLKGHFPCGWLVSAEDEFPAKATTVLF
jgi:hypothetical protein